MNDPRVLTDVGDVPIQEIRDCGVEDDRLMHVISESVKTVIEEVNISSHEDCFVIFFFFLIIRDTYLFVGIT